MHFVKNKIVLISIVLLALTSSASASIKQELNILVLGKSGVGKSSLINIFYNHAKGNPYGAVHDIVIPLLHRRTEQLLVNVEAFKAYNVKLNGGGRSQTSEVNKYYVDNTNYVINFLDAPGVLDTQGAATDAKNFQKIADAIIGLPIHAVIVVLDPKDQARDSLELKASINRIRHMLPNSFSDNLVAVFNRSGDLNRKDRVALTSWFADLFEMDKSKSDTKSYFIDGTSFFDDIAETDEDGIKLGKAKWQTDSLVFASLIESIAKNTPADGSDALAVQVALKNLENRMKTLAEKLVQFQSASTNLRVLEAKLEKEEEAKEANKDFRKTREVEFEVIELEAKGGLLPYVGVWPGFGALPGGVLPGALFGPSVDYVKKTRKQKIEFDDEGQQKEYLKALSAIKENTDKLVFCQKTLNNLKIEQLKLVQEIKDAQAEREKIAMTTDLDPYIKYLEEQIRELLLDKELSQHERDSQVKMYRDWIKSYNNMRNTAHL